MSNRNFKLLIVGFWVALLAHLALGQSICSTAIKATWEPRNLVTKAGLVASYDPGNATATAGTGVAAQSNLVAQGTLDLLQATTANKPLISRKDNSGNLLLQSQTFQTSWSRSFANAFGANDSGAAGAGSFANTSRTLDPIGGNTADFLQEDGTAGIYHEIYQNLTTQLSADSYSYSVYIAPAGRTMCYLKVYKSASYYTEAFFDLSTGATGNVGPTVGLTGISSSIAPSNYGFFICTINFTVPAAGVGAYQPIIRPTTANGTETYNGDNTSGLFLWGSSLRLSAWDASYIPTTTVPIFPGLNQRSVLYFDGSARRFQTPATTLSQPIEIYSLVMPWTWTLNDVMCDGYTNQTMRITQSATTPNILMDAGTPSAEFTPPRLHSWQVVNAVFDGANSRISTNAGAFTVSDAGTGNAGGITLGSAGTAGTTYWNGLCGGLLVCNKTNDTAESNFLGWGLMKAIYVSSQSFQIAVVYAGDSIIAGHNTANYWYPLLDGGPTGTQSSEIPWQIYATNSIVTYVNCAMGGASWLTVTSPQIAEMRKYIPKAWVIACGRNDINAGRSWADVEANMNFVHGFLPSGATLFVCEVLPDSTFDDTKAGTVRTFNTNYAIWCSSNGAVLISCHDLMGQTRISTGELDDLAAAYSYDGTHLTQDGVNMYGSVIATNLATVIP